MRKLIESTLVSLDGVIDSPERWAIFDDEATQLSMQELDNYDAFVMGRVTYGWFRDNWSAGGGNPYLDRIAAMPKCIASRSLDEVTPNGTLLDGGDRIDDLTKALQAFGDPTAKLLVLAGTVETFKVALEVAVDPAYDTDTVLAGVQTLLRGAYSFEVREFCDPVYLSQIDATAQAVPGVLAIDVNRLYTGSTPSLADRLLAQQPAAATDGSAIPAGLLALDSAPFDRLRVMV